MNLLFPAFKRSQLPRMLGISLLGALIAGAYGAVHDQITYSISHEYFTKLKFDQFRRADFGFPIRVFVSEIGILATWWLGFLSGWFLARIAVPVWSGPAATRRCLMGFIIIFAMALTAALIGDFMGIHHSPDYSNWQDACDMLAVTDVPGFVRVACIHNAGYIGAAAGVIAAILFLLRLRKLEPKNG